MKKCVLLALLGLLTGCDDPCSPESAAGFYVAYRAAEKHDYIDWNLNYVAQKYIVKVENTNLIDKRYDTPVCRAKILNKDYDLDKMVDSKAKSVSYVCYTYVPRTGKYVQEYAESCCRGSIYTYYDEKYIDDYCWF